MIDSVLQLVAPHLCYGCGKTGTVLCDNCKYNIVSEHSAVCLGCGRPSGVGACSGCRLPYERGVSAGWYSDVLKELVDRYKFERVVAAARTMAELLDAVLPELPEQTVIVPVPTVAAHIRQRGYDHTLLIARQLAKLRQVPVRPLVVRASNASQRGKTRKVRLAQAEGAFRPKDAVDEATTYLVLDDVVTTGATVRAAASLLRQVGASSVWVCSVTRDPLDE